MRFVSLVLVFFLSLQLHAQNLNARQTAMTRTLDQVVTIFSEEYAPFEWKVQSEKFDLQREYDQAREKIRSNPDLSNPEFQDLLADFVSATRDFHVSISFSSTEAATLPIQIYGASGRYFVVYINREKLPVGSLPFLDLGSEVIEFDGVPTARAVRALVPNRIQQPNPAELRIAELHLTDRQRSRGQKVPTGEVFLKVADEKGNISDIPLRWDYVPEFVPKMPFRTMIKAGPRLARLNDLNDNQPWGVGGASMVPELGTVLSKTEGAFSPYLFRLPKGGVVGAIRIPTFTVEKPGESAEEFGRIMLSMQDKTDALVIDLTRNGGGDLAYSYGLLSRLTDRPLKTLPNKVLVSSSMAADSARRISMAPYVTSEKIVRDILGNTFAAMYNGYLNFQAMVDNDRFLLSELNAGRRLTNPTHLLGVSSIVPHPSQRYTKPILVLVDELDFSAADFFPAILQDNKRATIFGARTAGAGGAVKEIEFSNQLGVQKLAYTWTIAYRLDGQPLENNGVTPDVPYSPTDEDIRKGFSGYKQEVIKVLEAMTSR